MIDISVKDLVKSFDEDENLLDGISFDVQSGERVGLLGKNGAGKTTTLHLLSGALTPYRGTVQRTGRIGVLPQDPQALFVKKTVREDLYEAFDGQKLETALREKRLEQAVALCRLSPLLDRHPYDLSGGEQQRVAIADLPAMIGEEVSLRKLFAKLN